MLKRKFFLTANSITFSQILKALNPEYINGEALLIKQVSKFLGVSTDKVFLLNAGRMGLYLALKSLNLNENDEIIVPGYTCVVVTNAIKYTGAKAKYVDISSENLNLDTTKLKKSITSKTKAIIVSHNFGIPYEDIFYIKEKYPDIVIIEDSAHALGSKYKNGQYTGTVGDFAFFSLEYSKPITSGM